MFPTAEGGGTMRDNQEMMCRLGELLTFGYDVDYVPYC